MQPSDLCTSSPGLACSHSHVHALYHARCGRQLESRLAARVGLASLPGCQARPRATAYRRRCDVISEPPTLPIWTASVFSLFPCSFKSIFPSQLKGSCLAPPPKITNLSRKAIPSALPSAVENEKARFAPPSRGSWTMVC